MEYVDQIMRNSFHVLRVVHYGQIIREFMRSHFVANRFPCTSPLPCSVGNLIDKW